MTNAIKVLLQMQSGFLQLAATLPTVCPGKRWQAFQLVPPDGTIKRKYF
jgi:hypothetical protein